MGTAIVSASPGIALDHLLSAPALQTQPALRRANMNALKMAGIALIAAGVLGLVYGSFSFTKETHEAKIGPIELSIKDKQTVNVPIWAGVGAIVIGGALLVFGGKRG
jgi:uncharacterized membrane protein YidH (DUF202 family)